MNRSIDSRVVRRSCQRSEVLRPPAPGYLLDGAGPAGGAGAAGAADGANFGANTFLRLQGPADRAGQLSPRQLPLVLAGTGEKLLSFSLLLLVLVLTECRPP
jgi:hypothetical protein